MTQVSKVDATNLVPFVEDGVTVGQVHWLSDGQASPLVSGIWRALPGEVPEAIEYNFPTHETIQVLEGSVTIEFADGETVTLNVGDIAAVEQGTKSVWKVDSKSTFRKFFVCQ